MSFLARLRRFLAEEDWAFAAHEAPAHARVAGLARRIRSRGASPMR